MPLSRWFSCFCGKPPGCTADDGRQYVGGPLIVARSVGQGEPRAGGRETWTLSHRSCRGYTGASCTTAVRRPAATILQHSKGSNVDTKVQLRMAAVAVLAIGILSAGMTRAADGATTELQQGLETITCC